MHVWVCVCVRWVVGHLQLQAVCVCPNGKVLFSLSSRGPQAVCGGYLFTLSLGTLLYGQYTHTHTHTQRHARAHRKSPSNLHNSSTCAAACTLSDSWNATAFTSFLDTARSMYCKCLSQLILCADTNTHAKALSSSCKFYMHPPSQQVCRG